jgi:hypothetical protein
VKLALECSCCGVSQVERLHVALVRLAYVFGVAALLTTSLAFLGKSAETFQPQASDSGLPSLEDPYEGPGEAPWMFAKEMSEAVGRDVSNIRKAPPRITEEE